MTARCALYMGALKFFESLSTPTATFPEILMGFCSDRSYECAYKICKFVALPVPEIIAIDVLDGGCEPQSWGNGGHRGSGMAPFERAFASYYMGPPL